ncbi:hypothetical protein BGZ60DRAFT_422219 [Tricladium varicosporioides]|nr:hypothetical protein BGZ60DRAFT_422219 [Hymenoscyphus varicosporioides]
MSPPNLPEEWDRIDNWSGVASAAERRKRQNRLNQRAYRKRRHLQRCAPHTPNKDLGVREPGYEPNDGTSVSSQIYKRSRAEQQDACNAGLLEWLTTLAARYRNATTAMKQRIFLQHSLRLQAPSDLPNLVRLNVINALASNAVALSIPFLDLGRDECVSPFNLVGPSSPGTPSAPDHLRPTALQKTKIHHPWIDIYPFPNFRDNILRAIDAKVIDEDELCSDLFLPEGTDGALAPVVVWGEPSDAMSWEFSPGFVRKWGSLLRGCPEILTGTNLWRQRRGQIKITFVISSEFSY